MATPVTFPPPASPYGWLERIDPDQRLLKGKSYTLTKRVMDLALLFAALPLILAVLTVCALLIKLDAPRDPVIFVQ